MAGLNYTKQLLQGYGIDKSMLENYPFEIEMINTRLYSSGCEQVMVDMIDAKDRLMRRVRKAEINAKKAEKAMSVLTPYERELIYSFYVSPAHRCADRMAEKYSVERATIYRDKDRALRKVAERV